MGRYCVEGDIRPSLVSALDLARLTNDDSEAVTTNTDVLDQMIEDAESEVDTYVGHRFSLPLPSVPVVVKRLSARIARYRIYTSRGGQPEQWVTDDYAGAIKALEAIRDGKLSLGLTAAAEDPGAAGSAASAVRIDTVAGVFGRDNLKDY